MGEDYGQEELVTEEMLWDRIPEVQGEERANTFYELSARIFARGQYDEALALAETARDIFSELGTAAQSEGLAQAYSAIGYNLNQLKRMDEAATAMSQAVSILRENKSPIALELACTLGEWWYASKNYEKVIETMYECSQEHLVDGNTIGAANDMHLIGCAQRELKNFSETFALFEFGKAEILLGKLEDGLSTLDGVLLIIAEDEPKDFDFILDIETRMVSVMRQLGRMEEADEVERRLKSVREALAEEPAPSEDGF